MVQRYNPDYIMHAARFEPFARESEHGEYVRFDAHQQAVRGLEAERDALVAENQAMADSLSLISSCYGLSPHIQSMCVVETPTTDAALAAIRNEATARALKHLCDCQLISATVAELKADELLEAK
ncbi:hypothetical protein HP475_15260 [Serratia marcescens]|uniref:hypothetical protein n=1 Tax=Serratia marcescens TaxID=615 RepID=UPI0015D869B0|nr:hypothetical protein [Serratia marcescens]QLJ61192.1 hypothetical protein HP475_15260 [Serratia marcescens]